MKIPDETRKLEEFKKVQHFLGNGDHCDPTAAVFMESKKSPGEILGFYEGKHVKGICTDLDISVELAFLDKGKFHPYFHVDFYDARDQELKWRYRFEERFTIPENYDKSKTYFVLYVTDICSIYNGFGWYFDIRCW